MRKGATLVACAVLAALLIAPAAEAAPVPIAASLQWRGHLPELGTRPSVRLFQTAAQYETFRSGLSDPNLFPPASRLFMSFERDVLALYARGDDAGGRCLWTGSTAWIDGDTVQIDLGWEHGTCGAPSTARHPFILVSLSRTASGGASWVQPARSVCGTPPGVDAYACASVGSGTVASPSPTRAATAPPSPSPAATTPPSPSPTTVAPSPSPAPVTPPPSPSPVATTAATTAARTVAPTVAVASPTPTRAPDPTPRPVDVPTDDTVNYLLWGALGLIVLFVIIAGLFARSPRR